MNQFINSLARLYRSDKIDIKKIKELLNSKKINQQEYDYIIAVKNDQ